MSIARTARSCAATGSRFEHTQKLRDQQVAGRRALDARLVDEPPCPGDPATGPRHLAPQ